MKSVVDDKQEYDYSDSPKEHREAAALVPLRIDNLLVW